MRSYKSFLGRPKGGSSSSSRDGERDNDETPEPIRDLAAQSTQHTEQTSAQPEPENSSTNALETPAQGQADHQQTVEPQPLDSSSQSETSSSPSKYINWKASFSSLRNDKQSDAASIGSSSAYTASTVQSSLFSRGRTSGTRSTVPSSRYSGKGLGSLKEGQSSGDSTSNPVTLMKLVEEKEYSPAEETVQKDKSRFASPSNTRRSSSRPHTVGGSRLMPEVPIENAYTNTSSPLYAKGPSSSHNRPSPIQATPQNSRETLQNSSQHASSSSSNAPPPPPQNVNPRPHSSNLILSNELNRLAENLLDLFDQVNNGLSDPISAAGLVSCSLEVTMSSSALQDVNPDTISMHTEPALLKIIKVVLHFVDNLLNTNQLHRQRHSLLHKLYTLGVKLKLLPDETTTSVHLPHNFAVGAIPELPCQEPVLQILELAASHESESTMDQHGAFIAPVLRGFAPEFSVMSLIFGYPSPRAEHFKQMSSLCNFRPDLHMLCQKNYIRACGGIKAPFRVPSDPLAPPISMSLSKQCNATVSGTLGGYIFPKVDPENERLAQFSKSTFAVTCGHVCLDKTGGSGTPINVPSTFLATLFQNSLCQERDKYSPGSHQYKAYDSAVVETSAKYSSGAAAEFGKVIWGERTVIDKHLSDVAIIKCNDNLKCKNYLGDDISFAEYDAGLMFGNLYVKKVISKPTPGMKVFKYGSTSRYTSGLLSGPRIVYWADGRLQSSEFVVSSNSPGFATGGDSGAWILQKNGDEEDYIEDPQTVKKNEDTSDQASTTTTQSKGGPSLGVIGMLHSYDGDRREFGLYTPMTRILDRLEQVTTVKWGVVGVADDDEVFPVGGSDSSDNDEGISSEGD